MFSRTVSQPTPACVWQGSEPRPMTRDDSFAQGHSNRFKYRGLKSLAAWKVEIGDEQTSTMNIEGIMRMDIDHTTRLKNQTGVQAKLLTAHLGRRSSLPMDTKIDVTPLKEACDPVAKTTDVPSCATKTKRRLRRMSAPNLDEIKMLQTSKKNLFSKTDSQKQLPSPKEEASPLPSLSPAPVAKKRPEQLSVFMTMCADQGSASSMNTETIDTDLASPCDDPSPLKSPCPLSPMKSPCPLSPTSTFLQHDFSRTSSSASSASTGKKSKTNLEKPYRKRRASIAASSIKSWTTDETGNNSALSRSPAGKGGNLSNLKASLGSVLPVHQGRHAPPPSPTGGFRGLKLWSRTRSIVSTVAALSTETKAKKKCTNLQGDIHNLKEYLETVKQLLSSSQFDQDEAGSPSNAMEHDPTSGADVNTQRPDSPDIPSPRSIPEEDKLVNVGMCPEKPLHADDEQTAHLELPEPDTARTHTTALHRSRFKQPEVAEVEEEPAEPGPRSPCKRYMPGLGYMRVVCFKGKVVEVIGKWVPSPREASQGITRAASCHASSLALDPLAGSLSDSETHDLPLPDHAALPFSRSASAEDRPTHRQPSRHRLTPPSVPARHQPWLPHQAPATHLAPLPDSVSGVASPSLSSPSASDPAPPSASHAPQYPAPYPRPRSAEGVRHAAAAADEPPQPPRRESFNLKLRAAHADLEAASSGTLPPVQDRSPLFQGHALAAVRPAPVGPVAGDGFGRTVSAAPAPGHPAPRRLVARKKYSELTPHRYRPNTPSLDADVSGW